MKWVTREYPKTDRIACPWLIHELHARALRSCCHDGRTIRRAGSAGKR